jgi:hypothetical protein
MWRDFNKGGWLFWLHMPRVELVVPISESSTVLSLIKKILGFPL